MMPNVAETVADFANEFAIAKAEVAFWSNEKQMRQMERRSDDFVARRLQEAAADLALLTELADLLK